MGFEALREAKGLWYFMGILGYVGKREEGVWCIYVTCWASQINYEKVTFTLRLLILVASALYIVCCHLI